MMVLTVDYKSIILDRKLMRFTLQQLVFSHKNTVQINLPTDHLSTNIKEIKQNLVNAVQRTLKTMTPALKRRIEITLRKTEVIYAQMPNVVNTPESITSSAKIPPKVTDDIAVVGVERTPSKTEVIDVQMPNVVNTPESITSSAKIPPKVTDDIDDIDDKAVVGVERAASNTAVTFFSMHHDKKEAIPSGNMRYSPRVAAEGHAQPPATGAPPRVGSFLKNEICKPTHWRKKNILLALDFDGTLSERPCLTDLINLIDKYKDNPELTIKVAIVTARSTYDENRVCWEPTFNKDIIRYFQDNPSLKCIFAETGGIICWNYGLLRVTNDFHDSVGGNPIPVYPTGNGHDTPPNILMLKQEVMRAGANETQTKIETALQFERGVFREQQTPAIDALKSLGLIHATAKVCQLQAVIKEYKRQGDSIDEVLFVDDSSKHVDAIRELAGLPRDVFEFVLPGVNRIKSFLYPDNSLLNAFRSFMGLQRFSLSSHRSRFMDARGEALVASASASDKGFAEALYRRWELDDAVIF